MIRNRLRQHPLLILVALLAVLSSHSNDHAAEAMKPQSIITNPPYYDGWCQEYCSSLSACNTLFDYNASNEASIDAMGTASGKGSGGDGNYLDLRIRLHYPFSKRNANAPERYSGQPPGEHLIYDNYFGSTIARQTFETQVLLDMSRALDTSVCRFHILDVNVVDSAFNDDNDDKNLRHDFWNVNHIFLTFRIFPKNDHIVPLVGNMVSDIEELTKQIQLPTSKWYRGLVTYATDPLYGLVVLNWDHSLKLLYSIGIIGGEDVIRDDLHGRYLNQGSLGHCRDGVGSLYCTFEKYLRDDVERALDLQPGQFTIRFIKEQDRHSVVVDFRLIPPYLVDSNVTADHDRVDGQCVAWIHSKLQQLIDQMSDAWSSLYSGNVTFRIDPTWGISRISKQPRQFTKYLSRPIPSTSEDKYERCKAAQRCPRGSSFYNASSAESRYWYQEFQGGKRNDAILFLDFEDWRRGIKGWEQSCRRDRKDKCLPVLDSGESKKPKPAGAHWSPFQFDSFGPRVETFGKLWNSGLVLNKNVMQRDIDDQLKLIEDHELIVAWVDKEFYHGVTDDVRLRSREEIRNNITDYSDVIMEEKDVLESLVQSQCANVECKLLFNTSNAMLSGAVNATGVIATTPDGTEVAVWAFDSIDIDENVHVTLTGQRAMALVSRSSARINTTLKVTPGTLGGFPGGFSVSRRPFERLVRVCNQGVEARGFLDVCEGEDSCCPGDVPIDELANGIISNNVNGPGSPSTRVYLMTVQTSAPKVDEIHLLTTNANKGQTISGGFRLKFGDWETPFLPHDITANELKRRMEDSLNPVKWNQLTNYHRLESSTGIGLVGVTRERYGTSGGYQWKITFSTSIGRTGIDSSSLAVINHLVSKGSSAKLEILQYGNSIGGKFSLRFLGNETRPIYHDVSASELQEVIMNDIELLTSASVIRSDPTNRCNDGLCVNGPGRAGGYIWTLTLTTEVGNVSPFSPTSSDFDNEGHNEEMTALNFLTGCVESNCPMIQIHVGHSKSHNVKMRSVLSEKPFSLAYRGAGAGYGGGKSYGDAAITNLYGGSGGGVGVSQPFLLAMFTEPRGRGGNGGGAIEIIAANDIVLGSHAMITCDGEAGANGYMFAGGGGSGGSILLAAGGALKVEGSLSVAGGDGGFNKGRMTKNQSDIGHGSAGSGGRIALFGQSVTVVEDSSVSILGGQFGRCENAPVDTAFYNCTGDNGTLFIQSDLESEMSLDHTVGAMGTRSSLFIRPRTIRPAYDPRRLMSSTHSGPEFDFAAAKKPSKISFYVRLGNSSESDWDASFELRDARWSYLASKSTMKYTAVVGLVFGNQIRHQTNYIGAPYDITHVGMMQTIQTFTQREKWIKVDILLDWKKRTHDILIDDVRLVKDSPFIGGGIRGLAVGNFYGGSKVWFDEIYIGDDTTMGFRCPLVSADGTIEMDRPLSKGWRSDEVGDESKTRQMKRHESHISLRPIYQRDDNKYVVPYEGEEGRLFTSDVKFRHQDGDRPHEKGRVFVGSIIRVPSSHESYDDQTVINSTQTSSNTFGKSPDKYIWYGEHDHRSDPRLISGAVMACSTRDFVTWKHEGVMLRYNNLTDMVDGSEGPFRVEKPSVLFNSLTKKYVMWMIVDNAKRSLGMAGVATSDYPNGPFEFVRTLYPDGNQTRDQTLLQDEGGTAYLIRTYYYTTTYRVPGAVMQPTWESVKNFDGTINFALSYHRAEYEPGYDDYHDIYLQRWRMEDKPWKLICVNRSTGVEREVPFGEEEVCLDPFEYKKVLGLGNPMYESTKSGIQSRFLDPNDPDNNVWVPSSVPDAKGQSWKSNYEAGTCGKHSFDEDIQLFDPSLSSLDKPNRGNCSNIVDNPIHPTLPDKRIGKLTALERRRAKYVAVSRLTDDYLDTDGFLTTYEGELEDGADLLTIVNQLRRENDPLFDWKMEKGMGNFEDMFRSTFQDVIIDRYGTIGKEDEHNDMQYNVKFGDRSFFSPGCVIDGDCIKN